MAVKGKKTSGASPHGDGNILTKFYRRYLIDAMGAMALGLFATLIIGLIMEQFGRIELINPYIEPMYRLAMNPQVVGAAIGVAVAMGLKVKPLALVSCAAAGAVGYDAGGPIGCYLAAVVGAELGNFVSGKTKLDIVLVPLVTIIVGGGVGLITGPYINMMMKAIQEFLAWSTELTPIVMGIVIAVIVGLALTAPISSAALCFAIFTPQAGETLPYGLLLAAGAATAGCCAQMVGFAVASYRENGVGGLIAQGIGTSMLQVGNILRHPQILIPATLASAVCGPLATTVFKMLNQGAAAGMGTSGLVGQFGTWALMAPVDGTALTLVKIAVLHFIIPMIVALGTSEFMRKRNWIHAGDMKLEN